MPEARRERFQETTVKAVEHFASRVDQIHEETVHSANKLDQVIEMLTAMSNVTSRLSEDLKTFTENVNDRFKRQTARIVSLEEGRKLVEGRVSKLEKSLASKA